MFYILKKFKYIRGYEHEVPPMVKDGFDSQEKAEKALAALQMLEPRPDLVTYIIVRDLWVDVRGQQWPAFTYSTGDGSWIRDQATSFKLQAASVRRQAWQELNIVL